MGGEEVVVFVRVDLFRDVQYHGVLGGVGSGTSSPREIFQSWALGVDFLYILGLDFEENIMPKA